jgi:hypothetical protein
MCKLRVLSAVLFGLLFSLSTTAQMAKTSGKSAQGPVSTVRIICDVDCFPTPTPTPTPTPPPQDFTFNVTDYELIYPDIKNVYGDNTAAATTHYQLFGLPAGRRGSIVFDPVFYLQKYPDLLAAFGPTGYQAAAQHFINQGLPVEGRQGSAEFDVQYYLANNPDIAAAYGATNYEGGTYHFVNQGLPVEGRRGSAQVDVKTYINNYPDVAAAYPVQSQTPYYGPMLHWLSRGKGFQRTADSLLPTVSAECTSSAPPPPFLRVYVGLPGDGRTLDEILRPYSGDPVAGIPATDSLIVCILPGVYVTDGAYNWVINFPHSSETVQDRGFALGPHWHIHGYGTGETTVRLNSYYLPPPGGEPASQFVQTGSNVAFSTGSDTNPGVEISDLTIDCNYPALKAQAGTLPLRLEAIHLRDHQGGHYIHRVNVINAASEDPLGEGFPVHIVSVAYNEGNADHANPSLPPSQDNTIEFVTMSQWHGNTCTAITMAYATGAIQFNVVNGYQIAYGGWEMPFVQGSGGAPNKFVYIHDNWAINGQYGFNIDSEYNDWVNIQFNQIINPSIYGIVVGSSNQASTRFNNFQFLYNTIDVAPNGVIFNGNVTNAVVARTDLVAGLGGTAFGSMNNTNFANVYQYNQVDAGFGISSSMYLFNCIYNNWDQNGNPRSDFPNNSSTPCLSGL